ncbi:MAG: DUF6353 family protein [Clostridium sp.]|nr:DUF6353 family protein [Clostridium sp.]
MKKIAIRKHMPAILTYAGVCGVVGTAVMAVKATPKALSLIQLEKERINAELYKTAKENGKEEFPRVDKLTPKEVIAVAWKCYIPSIMFGFSTIACIISIHALDKRNQASLASAYAMLNETYKQYRNAAKTVYGEDADAKIQAEIAKDTFISADGIGVYSSDLDPSEKVLCYDSYSKRYFESTMAAVLNAEYHINRNLQLRGYSTINEFYEFLGIEGLELGDEIAWELDSLMDGGIMWLDFENHMAVLDDGLECCIVSAVWCPDKFDGELDI